MSDLLYDAHVISVQRQRWHRRRDELLWRLLVLLLWETI